MMTNCFPGLGQLGVSETYVDAQRIVTALERAKTDPDYFTSAAEILNSYVEPERTLVINKAIALGADPEILRAIAVSDGEVIIIEGQAPIVLQRRKIPWWAVALGGLASGAVIAFKWRAARSIL